MTLPCTPGVYLITNLRSRRIYIGKAVNLARRWAAHLAKLRAGTHHNTRLQADWNEFGERAFTFSVHAEAPEANISALEQALIADNMGEGCYNWSPLGSQGRPKVADDKRLIQRSIRLKAEDWNFIHAIGLPKLRELIEAA